MYSNSKRRSGKKDVKYFHSMQQRAENVRCITQKTMSEQSERASDGGRKLVTRQREGTKKKSKKR